jgi:hypothetical protein
LLAAAPEQRTTYDPTAKVELIVRAVAKLVSLARYKAQVGFVVKEISGFLV